jgi:hypothetical protein
MAMEVSYGVLPPGKQLEICNAVNAALVAGKTVTVDHIPAGFTTQIAGAYPDSCGVSVLKHKDWKDADIAPVIRLNDAYIIRAYFPADSNVDVIYNPKVS